MENIAQKAAFLNHGYIPLLQQINPATKPLWGKMNAQQMIEHMTDYTRIANGKDVRPVVTDAEALPKYRAFMETEKPFKENTGNPLMPDTPAAEKHDTIQNAIAALQSEINDLFKTFEHQPQQLMTNPIFGELNYDQSIQLLHKHAVHHLKQFGVAE